MITVFVLMLMTGPDRQVSSTNMIFMDLQQCNFYAARLVKSYTNNGGSAEQIMTRCIPRQAKIVLQ